MPVLDAHDPVIVLADQILALLPGHANGTAVAALAACLGLALDRAAERGAQPPAGRALRYELQQLAAQIIAQRPVRES